LPQESKQISTCIDKMQAVRVLSLLVLSGCVGASAEAQKDSQAFAIESSAALSNVGDHGASLLRRESEATTGGSKGVSWQACTGGKCKCTSRRRTVIRYHRENGASARGDNLMTNWFFRSSARSTRPEAYNATPKEEFNKGFSGNNSNNLQACGGDKTNAKDCLVEPTACSFDKTDLNWYDAKVGEYCCDFDKQYCSYRCKEDEEFACPALTSDINFPGGMDPAGPSVYKKCYMAQYPHGLNPESASDGDASDTLPGPN